MVQDSTTSFLVGDNSQMSLPASATNSTLDTKAPVSTDAKISIVEENASDMHSSTLPESHVVLDTIALTCVGMIDWAIAATVPSSAYWHVLDPWWLKFNIWCAFPPALGFIILPSLYCIPWAWRFLRTEDGRMWTRLATSVFYFLSLQLSPFSRSIILNLGFSLVFARIFTAPTAQEIVGLVNGLFLFVSLRWSFSTINPAEMPDLWSAPIIMVGASILSTFWLSRKYSSLFGVERPKFVRASESSAADTLPWHGGLIASIGTAFSFSLLWWLYTSDAPMVRWNGLSSYPYGLSIVFCMLLGVCLAHSWYVAPSMKYRYIISGATFALYLVGGVVMIFMRGSAGGFAGGCLLIMGAPHVLCVHVLCMSRFMQSPRARVRWLYAFLHGFLLMLCFGFIFLWLVGRMLGEKGFPAKLHGNPVAVFFVVWSPALVTFALLEGLYLRKQDHTSTVQPTSATHRQTSTGLAWTAAIIVVVLLLPGLRMRSWYSAQRGSQDVSQYFTVMSYNIQEGYEMYTQSNTGMVSLSPLADAINRVRPHVACLQETDSAHMLNGNRDIAGFLAERTMSYLNYGAESYIGTPGVGTLSAHKPINSSHVLLERHGGPLNRILVHDLIEVYDPLVLKHVPVHVFNTHAEAFTEEAKREQVLQIVREVNKTTGPAVLMGDFNVWANLSNLYPIWNPDNYGVMRFVNYSSFDNNWNNNVFLPTETYGYKSIDHIYYRDLCLVGQRQVMMEGASDHMPLVAQFSTHDPITGLPCKTPITWEAINNSTGVPPIIVGSMRT